MLAGVWMVWFNPLSFAALSSCSPFCRFRDIFPRPREVFPERGSLTEKAKFIALLKSSPFGRAGTASAVTERVPDHPDLMI